MMDLFFQQPCPRFNRFTLTELMVILSVIGLLFAIVVPSLIKAQQKSQALFCANNLRRIQEAKSIIGMNASFIHGDRFTKADLLPQMQRIPECPSGGVYDFGQSDTLPTCSFAQYDPRHVCPTDRK